MVSHQLSIFIPHKIGALEKVFFGNVARMFQFQEKAESVFAPIIGSISRTNYQRSFCFWNLRTVVALSRQCHRFTIIVKMSENKFLLSPKRLTSFEIELKIIVSRLNASDNLVVVDLTRRSWDPWNCLDWLGSQLESKSTKAANWKLVGGLFHGNEMTSMMRKFKWTVRNRNFQIHSDPVLQKKTDQCISFELSTTVACWSSSLTSLQLSLTLVTSLKLLQSSLMSTSLSSLSTSTQKRVLIVSLWYVAPFKGEIFLLSHSNWTRKFHQKIIYFFERVTYGNFTIPRWPYERTNGLTKLLLRRVRLDVLIDFLQSF